MVRSINTHFISPDSTVADKYNTLDWDRYAYARSNPLKYSDPSGHAAIGDTNEGGCNTPGSPKCIIDRYGYNSTAMDRELENYHRAYPKYDPSTDPALEGPETAIVAAAITRVGCDNGNNWACAGMVIVAGLSSPGPALNQPAESAPQNYGNDPADPDCSGCGYQNPYIELQGNYSLSYTQKLQNAYRVFQTNGLDITEHALNSLMGRANRGVTIQNTMDTAVNGAEYYDPKYGTVIKYKDGISVSLDPNTGTIISVQTQQRPTTRWTTGR